MDRKITIKNLTFNNLINYGAPLFFLGFIYFCAFKIGIPANGILRKFLIFLYISGLFLTLLIIEYFSTIVIIDENGLRKKVFYFLTLSTGLILNLLTFK